jgi:hypothetical protein
MSFKNQGLAGPGFCWPGNPGNAGLPLVLRIYEQQKQQKQQQNGGASQQWRKYCTKAAGQGKNI